MAEATKTHISLEGLTTLKAVVHAALLVEGLSELNLVGVFSNPCNLIASERAQGGDRVFVLLTDGSYMTLVPEEVVS